MSDLAKIERLLDITGTPHDRRDLARRNYQKLVEEEGESAIDARLAEFEAIHRDVANWRRQRWQTKAAPSRSLPVPVGAFLTREKVAVRRMEEMIDNLSTGFARLQSAKNLTDSDLAILEKRLRSIGFVLDYSVRHPTPSNHISLFLFLKHTFSWVRDNLNVFRYKHYLHDATQQMQAVERLLSELKVTNEFFSVHSADFRNRMDTQNAISGLGGVAGYVKDYSPDVVFAINDGGKIVGDFVSAHLELKVPVIILTGNAQGVTISDNRYQLPSRIERPLILDDVSRSGGTLHAALAYLTNRFPQVTPRAAAITASMRAIERIGEDFLHTPNPTENEGIQLPYNSRAGFKIAGTGVQKSYVFGAKADTVVDRLIVPAETIEKVVSERRVISHED